MRWRDRLHALKRMLRLWWFVLLEEVIPIVAAWWATRRLESTRQSAVDRRASEHTSWLLDQPSMVSEVIAISQGATERAATLEAKVAGVLGGLAVLTGAIGGIAIATWSQAADWERAMLLVSGGYSVMALLTSLAALQPRPMFELTIADLRRLADNSDGQGAVGTRVAALKLACEEANTNPVIRLSNLLQVISTNSRNAVLTGLAPLVGLVISHWS